MPSFTSATCSGRPCPGFGGGHPADDPGALRLQFQSGVQHQHIRAAGEQRLGAGDACRTGTDDTVHNYSLPPKRQWLNGNRLVQDCKRI